MQQGTIVAGNKCNREQKGTGFAWNRFSMGKKLFSNSFKFTNEFGTFTSKSFLRMLVLLIKKNNLQTFYYFAKYFRLL